MDQEQTVLNRRQIKCVIKGKCTYVSICNLNVCKKKKCVKMLRFFKKAKKVRQT